MLRNLLLQRTSYKTKTIDNKDTLERRLALWKSKRFWTLVAECLVVQSRLNNGIATKNTNIGEILQKQIMKVNVNDALRLLTNNQCNGILPLDNVTVNELHIKHPEASPMYDDDLLIQEPIALVNEVIFDSTNESEILQAFLKLKVLL